MWKRIAILAVATVVLVGCASMQRGVHTVPVSRDYQQLEDVSAAEAVALVEQAHRVGAQHHAAHDYFAAKAYAEQAVAERAESDRKGERDFASLAKSMAEAAIRDGSGIEDKGPMPMPQDRAACEAEWQRLKGRWEELDRDKAAEVAPVLYAHATAALSFAEHEISEWHYHWVQGARRMATVESDIDTIWSQDVDGDGICDMKDGAPWAPEDKDGFEDEDGIPDPDNDQDGILDLDDVAPNDPETMNRWHDFDGAPDAYPVLEMMHFASGSSALSADAKGYLRGVMQLLLEWPELKMHLAGHTDSTHSEAYNMKLSQRRAESVQKHLTGCGVPEGQLVVTFHGEGAPIADNNTGSGRAQNRRVELILE